MTGLYPVASTQHTDRNDPPGRERDLNGYCSISGERFAFAASSLLLGLRLFRQVLMLFRVSSELRDCCIAMIDRASKGSCSHQRSCLLV